MTFWKPVQSGQLNAGQIVPGQTKKRGKLTTKQSKKQQAVSSPLRRARNPFLVGSPGDIPCSLCSPATEFASRCLSFTKRSRRCRSRFAFSSSTVGIRTGDIASRSPPSQARSARRKARRAPRHCRKQNGKGRDVSGSPPGAGRLRRTPWRSRRRSAMRHRPRPRGLHETHRGRRGPALPTAARRCLPFRRHSGVQPASLTPNRRRGRRPCRCGSPAPRGRR